ncbi:tetratricopeptide repeat protein [Nibricoccus aquaticus]|nr:tetratricopeptide repeat protein [Nibricoccus aquaticus]
MSSRSRLQSAPPRTPWPDPVMFGLMLLVALAVYWPALRGEFIWDDDAHVTRVDLRSLGGLWRIWFEPGATQQFYPLLHSAFWMEHKLWGDAPIGYHLVNVGLHAGAATLFAMLLRRLAVPGAWLAGILFLVHPVCVESVAWISEQKNTLSLVLYLVAAHAYLRFEGKRSPGIYALATAVFVLALLTKTVTASLPAALLVVGWWRHGRLEWRRDVAPLLPWFVAGAVSGLFTAHFERVLIGAEGADFALEWADRLVLAGRVFWFYAGKLLWPGELMFFYPRWTIDAGLWWQWLFLAAGIALLGGLAWWARRARGPLAVALLFGGSLFPVLGFFNVYPFLFSYVADHFQYLASLSVFALAGAGLSRLEMTARWAAVVALSLVLGVLSWRQAGMYRDPFTLYETTLERNPACWMAHTNLGIALVESGRADLALAHHEEALRLRPEYAKGEHNYGKALNHLGRFAEAVAPLRRAVALKPDFASAHNELGAALMSTGRTEEGVLHLETAVSLSRDFGMAHWNLGLALALSERVKEALPHFEAAVRLMPGDVDVRLELSLALASESRYAEAIVQLEKALELRPDSVAAHQQLALVLRDLGRAAEAEAHEREAVRLERSGGR